MSRPRKSLVNWDTSAHLIEQANSLIRSGKKPRQVDLRRGISAAYYGLFHYLLAEATAAVFGKGASSDLPRGALARGVGHTEVAAACIEFATPSKNRWIEALLGETPVRQQVRNLAAVYLETRERREAADYDLIEDFKRAECLTLIASVDAAISDFSKLDPGTDRSLFVTMILSAERLKKLATKRGV